MDALQHALIKTQVQCCEILDPLTSLEFAIDGNTSSLIYSENLAKTARYSNWPTKDNINFLGKKANPL